MRVAATIAVVMAVVAASVVTGGPLFPAARFMRTGEADRAVAARVDGNETPVPARLVPCVNCHDLAGGGRREGAVRAADITWSVLQRPTSAGSGYDDTTFCKAVTQGVGVDGTPLARAMPRYDLTAVDCAALWAYLRRLDAELPPGVTHDTIVVGVGGPPVTTGQRAWWTRFREVLARAAGEAGIFGRRVEFVEGYARRATVRLLLDGHGPPAVADSDELLISVPEPTIPLPGREVWQVETPAARQLGALLSSEATWGVVRGEGAATVALAEIVAAQALDDGRPVPPLLRSCADVVGVTGVLALRASASTLPALRRLDRCRRPFDIVLVAPELDLSAFDAFSHEVRLAVPWRAVGDDLLWGATTMARAVDAALRSAGHRLRTPRLASALTASVRAAGGHDRALFNGVLLVPRNGGTPEWIPARGTPGGLATK